MEVEWMDNVQWYAAGSADLLLSFRKKSVFRILI